MTSRSPNPSSSPVSSPAPTPGGAARSAGLPRRGLLEQRLALLVALLVVFGAAITFDSVVSALNIRLSKEEIYPLGNVRFHTLNTTADGSRVPLQRFRIGADAVISPEEQEELGTDNFLSRWYEALDPPFEADGPVFVQLHVAYYTGMIDTVPHVPERCMVGAGMRMDISPRLVDVPLTFSDELGQPGFTLATDVDLDKHGPIYTGRCQEVHSRIRLPRGVENLQMNVSGYTDSEGRLIYAGYFFISNGRLFPTAISVRQSGISLTDKYAFYAKVQFLSSSVKSPEQLGVLAGQLLDEIFPSLARRTPDWIEVSEGRYPPSEAAKAASR
jgi:hypothetical protein